MERLTRRDWVVLLGAAAALRVAVVFGALHKLPLVSDAGEYARQAAAMSHHFPGPPAYYWPPGQSLYLLPFYEAFGASAAVAKSASILVDLAVVALTVLLAARVVVGRAAALVSGWTMALLPSAVLMSGEPYSFALTEACLLGTALLLFAGAERRSWALLGAAGAVFGFAVLVRPSVVSVLLVLAAVAGVLGRRRPRAWLLAGGAAFVVAGCAVVVPAVLHNERHGQGWTVSTANEQNLWLGNNPYTPDYKTWELGQHPPSAFRPAVARYLERFGVGHPTRAQRSAMLHETRRFVSHHLATTALRTFDRVQAFWGFDYTMSTDIRDAFGLSLAAVAPLLALEAGAYLALLLLALVALLFARARLRTRAVLFVLALVAGYQLSYALAYAAGRWHLPVLGLIAPLAAVGLLWLRSTPGSLAVLARSRSFWIAAAVVAAVQVVYAYVVWTHA
jgi:4-amino-4-deoxy-L-arabinose transferase-like glycosyltransferase